MKILNLYDFSHKTTTMTDREFLEKEIAGWLSSRERRTQITGEEYYEGKQDILSRERKAIGDNGELIKIDNLPNNKIIDNQFAAVADQKINYLCGKPVTFDCENETYGALLTDIFNDKMQRTLKKLLEESYLGGISWLYVYYGTDGELKFEICPAYEILPFWADKAHTELDCAVRFYPVYVYDENQTKKLVSKVEVLHGGGVDRFIYENGKLVHDNDAVSGAYVTVTRNNEKIGYNWDKIPLIAFKTNSREIPLITRVKCLQDALNTMLSNYMNNLEEDARNTILVIENYDGENLGEFRRNLATYGAVKVRSTSDGKGGVSTLEIKVDKDNYKAIIDIIRKAIINNARGYDAKDDRLSGTPNQLNIRSMYSDIDLDANGTETEFKAAINDLLWFINTDFVNSGKGSYYNEKINIIFNRDILINESEVINDCKNSVGILSDETIIKQHPWVDDPEMEMNRIKQERANDDAYRTAFESGVNVDE